MRIFSLDNAGASTEILDGYQTLTITDGSGLGIADTIAFVLPDFAQQADALGDRLYVLQPIAGREADIIHGPYDLQDTQITGPEHLTTIRGRKNLHWESQIANQELATEQTIIAALRSLWQEGSPFLSREPYKTWNSYINGRLLDDPANPIPDTGNFVAGLIYANLNNITEFSGIVAEMERWGLTVYSELDIDRNGDRLTATPFIQVDSRYPLNPAEGPSSAGTLLGLDRGAGAVLRFPLIQESPTSVLSEHDESSQYVYPSMVNRPARYQSRKITGERRLFGVGEDIEIFSQGVSQPEIYLEESVEYLAQVFVELKRWELQNTSQMAKITVPFDNDERVLADYIYPRMIINHANPTRPASSQWRVVGVTRTWEQGAYSESYDLALHQGYFYRIG